MLRKTIGTMLLALALPVPAQQGPNDVETLKTPSSQLVLFAMSDQSGPHLSIQPDGPTAQQFGEAALAGKFRRCP